MLQSRVSTVFLLSIFTAQAARIVFHEEPREDRRFVGLDPFPANTWATTTTNITTTTTTNATTELPTTTTTMDAETVCPQGSAWCSHPSNYPREAILKAASKQGDSLRMLFPVENKGLSLDPEVDVDETILGVRNGLPDIQEEGSGDEVTTSDDINAVPEYYDEEDGFENICGISTEYILPRAAKNKEGQFRFIVNQPEGSHSQYIQLVRVARCSGAGEECGWGSLGGRQTRCQQEYLDHKLVALSQSGEELVIDTFTFPSCCTCLMNTKELLY